MMRLVVRGALLVITWLTLCTTVAFGQTTGTLVGRVVDAADQEPLARAEVSVTELGRTALSGEDGRFVLAGVPAGHYTVRVELLSYRTLTLQTVEVRAGRRTNLTLALTVAALEVEPIVVEAARIPLIEPEVSESHHVLLGRQLRELPTDATEDAIELTPGVSDGHFRGGRVGQETYVIDGFGLKNQLEGSSQGLGLEFSPTALEEIDVTTGGIGAEYGSLLSGVVSFVTRRGDPDRWRGRARLLSDHWLPGDLSRGFTELSLSGGGPLPLFPSGSTIFADLLVQGLLDADPRARGLTCLRPGDAEPDLALLIDSLRSDPGTAHLYCPYTDEMFPSQGGDKLIGFLRLDVPLGRGTKLTGSLLRNRFQRQLYTPEFKYNPTYQLGQRHTGTLGTVSFDWAVDAEAKAFHLTARAAAMRLDRYLGVLDPERLAGRSDVAGFGLGDFEFLGEKFVRLPTRRQEQRAVPGYSRPGGSVGSPFGPAAEGIFFTEGTPGIANWTRLGLLGGDLTGELLYANGSSLRIGTSARFYSVESYERPFGYAPDSLFTFADYGPAALSGFAEVRVATGRLFALTGGLRLESFRSGLSFRPDGAGPEGPTVDADWKIVVMPRIGFAGAFRNSRGETAFRFNFTRVAQPPDFRFFTDVTVGDSLRTDIRRQGNPDLGFEKGRAFELGVSHVIGGSVGLAVTGFRKEFTNLVTGTLQVSTVAPATFSTADEGTAQGVELTAYGRLTGLEFRGGYTLQWATGLTSGALDPDVDPQARIEEFPLAHDRRHAIDVLVLAGRAAGSAATDWSAAVAASIRSGFPLDRRAERVTRLPWTALVGLRVSRDLGRLPLCSTCRARVIADGRNVIGRHNVIALRRDTEGLGPTAQHVRDVADEIPLTEPPIPRESARYQPGADLDADGLITASELRRARAAAELDRNDPSLLFGDARSVRLGFEIVF